jgi:hypothetical protein
MALAITGGASAHRTSKAPEHATVVVRGHTERTLHFSAVTEVEKGGTLSIDNRTPAPHTLSLVKAKLVPKTNQEISHCNDSGHICHEIAKWHKVHGQEVNENPARAGRSGWSTEGGLHRKGDSVFFNPGQNPGTREVHAPHGTVLTFICAIHPYMNGRVVVD